ncbi:MAG TPA: ATP-grasp domain-containing protein [Urbifossiella sp.]|nr:ATP-grasp domain-containing protein [Urbifossiella sp.]
MSDPKPFVGVVGASARAAVHSLYRAGFPVWAVDLFTDRDLFAPSARCPLGEYPRGLPALADQFFPGPVLYTGGLENHPTAVTELAARRPLWGNPPAVLERVRDPFFHGDVWQAGSGNRVRIPWALPAGEDPGPGRWLWKPRAGVGGYGIFFHTAVDLPTKPSAYYLQDFRDGSPMSAVFVAGETTHLLGVTEQLVGEPWLHAPRFGWCGNVGPVELPAETVDALARFGAALAWAGGLVGVFGVDFILDADDVAWPVELNPRYTGSVEVIEHATGRAVMLDHAAAFGAARGVWAIRRNPRCPVVAKAVYYAPRRFTFPAAGPWDDWERPFDAWNLPAFADVPAAGSAIEPGWPVFTLFEGGSSPVAVRARLQSRAAGLDRLFAAEYAP